MKARRLIAQVDTNKLRRQALWELAIGLVWVTAVVCLSCYFVYQTFVKLYVSAIARALDAAFGKPMP